MHVFADHAGSVRDRQPGLRVLPSPTGRTRAVVLVLHGGKAESSEPAREHQLAYRRMVPLARTLHRDNARNDTAVWLLRNRVRGWNESTLDAVADANWAIGEAATRHPGAQLVLLGHSLGGRVALRLGDRAAAVCALAPWVEDADAYEHLRGKPVLVAHGDRDRITSAAASERFANRISAEYRTVRGSGHAMLRRWSAWNSLSRDFVRTAVGRAR